MFVFIRVIFKNNLLCSYQIEELTLLFFFLVLSSTVQMFSLLKVIIYCSVFLLSHVIIGGESQLENFGKGYYVNFSDSYVFL